LTTAFRFRTREPLGGDDSAPEDAVAAELRFLEEVRARVAWQADAASRLRGSTAQPLDVLDVASLERLVAGNTDSPRCAEWLSFLDELAFLAEPGGRLPVTLERLVRVVFADLLEQ
jgi:hypothetical protein